MVIVVNDLRVVYLTGALHGYSWLASAVESAVTPTPESSDDGDQCLELLSIATERAALHHPYQGRR